MTGRAAAADAFTSLGIAGLGLIGGSVALAARLAWPDLIITGLDTPDVAHRAQASGVIDTACFGLSEMAECELVVLAAPMDAMVGLIEECGSAGLTGLVTDVGSTKRTMLAAAERAGLTRFIGGHPMAGSERAGLDHASAHLFAGCAWALVRQGATREADVAALVAFIRGLGARPVTVESADAHDRTMAFVSHLPQLVAVALMDAAGESVGREGLELVGPGFRGMTRLAGSPGPLWQDIIDQNADYVAEALGVMHRRLDGLSERAGPAAFEAAFARANAWHQAIGARNGGPR